jgi:5-amino-6-(5-phospho-D-ribitylamino)uracil phosphatase
LTIHERTQVIQEVFCWSRNPVEVHRMAVRQESFVMELLGDRRPVVPEGAAALLSTLRRSGVPVALVSSAPERRVKSTVSAAGIEPMLEGKDGAAAVMVSADYVARCKPDPEGYLVAAERIGRPPARCIVVGTSNLSVEAARSCGMKCVALAGRHPAYELTAADLVVRSLGELSFVNLKKLFAVEDFKMPNSAEEGADGPVGGHPYYQEEELEPEGAAYYKKRTAIAVMDYE